jgi:hypothetical protein
MQGAACREAFSGEDFTVGWILLGLYLPGKVCVLEQAALTQGKRSTWLESFQKVTGVNVIF